MESAYTTFLLVAAPVAATLGILAYTRRSEKKRRDALIRAAVHSGLSHADEDPMLLAEEFIKFPLFNRGYSRRFTNVMRGEPDGLPLILFDYQYTVSGGKSSNTYRQTAACFRLDRKPLPGFELRPENVLFKFAALFGYQDIDFESHPEFSKAFLLRGAEAEKVREEFTHERLTALERSTGWSVEGGGKWLVVYQPSCRVTPENFADFLHETREVARAFET